MADAPRPLHRRIGVRIGVVVTLFVIAVTAVQALAMRAVILSQILEVRRHVVEEGVALARLAARGETVEGRVLEGEIAPLETLILVYYDGEGRVVAASDSDPALRAPLDAEARAHARAAHGAPYYLAPLTRGARTEVIATTGDGAHTGYVRVIEDTPVAAMQTTRTLVVVAVLVVALVLALLVTLALTAWVRRSLAETELVVRRMGQGDLSVRLPPMGDHELGALVLDFNQMVDRLALRWKRFEGEEARRKVLLSAFTQEIQAPLASVLAHLESLAAPLDGEPDPHASSALEEAQRLSSLSEDLNTLFRLEYADLEMERAPFDLAEVAEAEAEAFGPRALKYDVTLRVEGTSAVVAIDRARVEQVLRILFDNAVRHARAGSVVRVVVSSAPSAIEVIDEGRGIAEEHLAELGTPLYRVDPERGRGLGLAIAKGLVKAHGGELSITSVVGEGTTVRIELP